MIEITLRIDEPMLAKLLSVAQIETPKPDKPRIEPIDCSQQERPNVCFAKLKHVTLDGDRKHIDTWQQLVCEMLDVVARRYGRDSLCKALTIWHAVGNISGYRYAAGADVSFQGMDASSALRTVRALAKKFHIKGTIRWEWETHSKAAHPGVVGYVNLR